MDYQGRIWVHGDDPKTALEAVVTVEGAELSIASKTEALGSWQLDDIHVERQGDLDFTLSIESYRLVFRPDSPAGSSALARALGVGGGLAGKIRTSASSTATTPSQVQHAAGPAIAKAGEAKTLRERWKELPRFGKIATYFVVFVILIAALTSRNDDGGQVTGAAASTTTTSPGATTTAKLATATTRATTTTTRATTTTRPTTTVPELPTISSGVYIVPSEVAPGTYRFVGYMARLDASQDIIDNDLVNGDNGLGIMIVVSTDAYAEINGEAILVDDTGPIDPIALGFTAGTYLVGYDIQPGRYRITPTADRDTAYWARLDKTRDIIDNDLGSGQLIVVVKASDWALKYTGTITELP